MDMGEFFIIYGAILFGSLLIATILVIGMKWLYEERIKRNK